MADSALFNSSSGSSFAELDFSAQTTIYLGIQVYMTTAQMAAQVGFSGGLAYKIEGDVGNFESINISHLGEVSASGDYDLPNGTFTPDTWHSLEILWSPADSSATMAFDGVAGVDNYGPQVENVIDIVVGAVSATGHAGQGRYVGAVWIGTTAGSHDILLEDWSDGNFSKWTTTFGSPTVGTAPSAPPTFVPSLTPPPPPPVLKGVLLAFTDAALAPTPTWTRIDDVKGVNVSTIQIKRGRPDARSKTSVGTASISGFDLVGDTDPTNTGGPWYGNLDPIKQATIRLYNPAAATWNPIYTGYTSDWTHVLDVSEKKLDFTLDLVDMLDMLNDAEIVPDVTGNLVPGESKGDVFYTGQHVHDRLLAVLSDAATAFLGQTWPTALLEIASGNVDVQGRVYANRTTLLQVIDEACDGEGPGSTNRFITVDGIFAFRGRFYRYTPEVYIATSGTRHLTEQMLHWNVGDLPAAELDPSLAVYTGLEFTRGKTNLINASLVTPLGIADGDISKQFVYDLPSIGQFAPRTEGTSYENIITGLGDDGSSPFVETRSFGLATVANYRQPVTRVSKLTFKNPPAGASIDRQTATWALICGIELSDLITITSTHPGGGGFVKSDHFVEGITYNLAPLRGDQWEVTLTLDLSPREYFATMPSNWQPLAAGELLAGFTYTPDHGAHPLSVTFTDASSAGPAGPITARHWDFGDGGTSTSTNPTHSFSAKGQYIVTLTVTGTAPDGTMKAAAVVDVT